MVLGAAHRSFDFLFSGAFPDYWAARHCSDGEEMTDRELLQMAAKAAGIKTIAWGVQFDRVGWFCNPTGEHWNPLEDDGDALRLAVNLNMELFASSYFACANDEEIKIEYDANKTMRRAIVLAAAQLGKEMK